jgi:hypothetical protein
LVPLTAAAPTWSSTTAASSSKRASSLSRLDWSRLDSLAWMAIARISKSTSLIWPAASTAAAAAASVLPSASRALRTPEVSESRARTVSVRLLVSPRSALSLVFGTRLLTWFRAFSAVSALNADGSMESTMVRTPELKRRR